MYAKTGCTVDNYKPFGCIKILMRNVERAREARGQNFWRLAEAPRAKGATEAGAFGQRGKRGRL